LADDHRRAEAAARRPARHLTADENGGGCSRERTALHLGSQKTGIYREVQEPFVRQAGSFAAFLRSAALTSLQITGNLAF
jgi:hypothetical protein